jgi:putative pyruvate formate lyase activating enzyme
MKGVIMNEKQVLNKIKECRICPRNCLIDRTNGEKGFCRTGTELIIFNDYIHYGEESELIPSQTIYLKGCNLRCKFCPVSNYLNDSSAGKIISVNELVSSILDGLKEGAKNVNFVGGEPTVFLYPLVKVMKLIKGKQKTVWNSNMYFNKEIFPILNDLIDIYLADLKFGNDECAKKLSDADNYSEVVRGNIKLASEQTNVIIRHLVIPKHLECCTIPVLEWIKRNLRDTKVSLMTNYTPNYKSGIKEINRFLNEDEISYINKLKKKFKLNYIV